MDSDRIAVDTSGRLAGANLACRSTGVAEHQLVGGQRNRFPYRVGADSLSQRRSGSLGRPLRGGLEDRPAHLFDPGVICLPRARGAIQQVMLIQQLGQQRSGPVDGCTVRPDSLALHAVADRLPEQRVRMLVADQPEQVPGPIGQDDTVDLGIVLHGKQQAVESVRGSSPREGRENAFRLGHVLAANGVAQDLAASLVRRRLDRTDRMKHLGLAPAVLLNPACVAVEHLEHGKRTAGVGQFHRHVVGRGQGHHRVEAHVVLAAEGPRVGQGSRRDQLAEIRAGSQPSDQERQQPIGRGLLHHIDKRLQRAEGEPLGPLLGRGLRKPQFDGRAVPDRGNQHPAAHLRKKLPTSLGCLHDRAPMTEKAPGRTGMQSRSDCGQPSWVFYACCEAGQAREMRSPRLVDAAGISNDPRAYRCHGGARKLVASSNVALRRKSAGS